MGFQVQEAAEAMVRELAQVAPVVARADRALGDQLRRAASSVPLNIAEANGRAGGDRHHHFRVAAGSAREVRSALGIAEAWGYLKPGAAAGALAEADRVLAMLWRLTH